MDLRLSRIDILLLEDDTLFAQSLEEFLTDEGFAVTVVASIEQALDTTFDKSFDLYIFDINLPDGDGKELLKELRQSRDETPTLFLTSYTDKQTLHEGFACGADDYLKKPVDIEELMLRIQALLKRTQKVQTAITFSNGVTFDMHSCRLYDDKKDLKLTLKAAQLLHLFIHRSDQLVTKEDIEQELWKDGGFSEGSLRVYINRLKKVLPTGSITNIKGIGYRFERR